MKITCVISSLAGGGAERCMVDLVDSLDRLGYEVTLLTLFSHIPDAYVLPSHVKRVSLPTISMSTQYWYQEFFSTGNFVKLFKRAKRRWKIFFLYVKNY